MVAELAKPVPTPEGQQPAEGEQPPPIATHISVDIISAETGTTVASHEPTTAYTPASSTKVPTALAALTVLGPDHTFSTTALLSGSTVTLRGGGDQLLGAGESDPALVRGHAGLATLARQSAQKLKDRKITTVSVALDDTLWGAQDPHPDWVSAQTTAFAGKIAPLAINTGLANPDLTYGYVDDPAMAATQRFVEALTANGITVTGVSRAATPEGATTLASVTSAPLAEIVRETLKDSDNVLAEGLCRASALATHHEPTYDGGVATVRETLAGIGVDTEGYQAHDCSGLSENGKISASVLAHSLAVARDAKQPRARSLGSALPVAALDGTLHDRWMNTDAAGIVRAKTGSLGNARSLTGFVPTASGEVLIYSVVIADYADGQGGHVLDELDRMVSGVAAL
nr:D-alanyl-D-alanine carboxypeptidase/D-alanyl-D-alanine-endopeptidase [Nanchangia anserum]